MGFLWSRAIATSAFQPNSVLLTEVQVGGSNSYTFTVSGGARDLRLMVRGAGTTAATYVTVQVQFNGDSGTNYDWESITFNNTSSSTSAGFASQTSLPVGFLPASTGPTNAGGSTEVIIQDYSGAVFTKSVMARSGVRTGSGAASLYATAGWGDWNNTAAVTSVTVSLSAGNFAAGSTVSLYGSI